MKACDSCEFRKFCAMSNIVNGCSRYKKDETTNEQWIKQASTEQLAEYILNVWLDGALNVNAEFGLNEAQIERHKKYIVEWLKQPHTPKE